MNQQMIRSENKQKPLAISEWRDQMMDISQASEQAVSLLPPSLTFKEVDDVAVITFDVVDEKVNTLHTKLFPHFGKILDHLQSSSGLRSVVIRSGKPGSFIAGADIKELKDAKNEDEVYQLSQKGQEIFARLASLHQPVVAAIDGACLGGGLELALACDYRIASTSSKTRLGVPEVMLGLIPGAGGTQRLPALLGLEKALQLMLTGMQVSAEKAIRIGLVDYLVHPLGLEQKAIAVAKALADGSLKVIRKKQKGSLAWISRVNAGKKFILKKAAEGVKKKTRGLYPAPEGLIEVLKETIENPANGYSKESEVFARLSATSQCRGLISLYFGQNELKKNPFGSPSKPIKQIAVLGAGLMGAGISLISARKGFQVRMKDLNQEQLSLGKKYIWDQIKGQIKRRSLSTFEAQKLLSQVITQTGTEHFSQCELFIEAVFEDQDLKHRVLREVEEAGSKDLIFASNTSAIPIAEIAKVSRRPERVIGMHYFSPVHKMPLLEVVVTPDTSEEVKSAVIDVGLRQGKTVIIVNDGWGFYTTRILAPFMDEAAMLVMEGVDIHTLDRAIKDFGYPVGPIALIDEVGIDVALHVSQSMRVAFGERVSAGRAGLLEELLEADARGRKSRRGFYLYQEQTAPWYQSISGRRASEAKAVNPQVIEYLREHGKNPGKGVSWEDIQKRMCYRMLNEAAWCLHDGVLNKPVDGDIGAVFGLGFPAFHGGPFRYMDARGVGALVDEFKRYQDTYGSRFEPCPLLEEMATDDRLFYD